MGEDPNEYAEERIESGEHPLPKWLFWSYMLLLFWGVVWGLLYWNGMSGWLDRGYWFALEEAANTTW